jgi:hypothetical protein
MEIRAYRQKPQSFQSNNEMAGALWRHLIAHEV